MRISDWSSDVCSSELMKVVFAVPPECSLGKSLKARIVTENKYRHFIQIVCRNGDMLVRSGEAAMLLQIGGEFSGTGHLFFRRRRRQRYIRRNVHVRPGRRDRQSTSLHSSNYNAT